MRLAVVSSDGKNVDLHLGRGNSIYVYDYDGELTFVENRNLEIAEDSKVWHFQSNHVWALLQSVPFRMQ